MCIQYIPRNMHTVFALLCFVVVLHWLIFPYPSGLLQVYPKKYAHGFVVLCFVVVMQSFIMNSHEVFIHIHQGCFAGTGAIVILPQCQWSKPDGYGKISQCITTTKHSKAKTVCIFLGIYCRYLCQKFATTVMALRWRHNELDGVSDHQPHDCLLNLLFRRRSKKISKLRVTGLCVVNSPWTGEFPAQRPVTRKMFPFDGVIMGTVTCAIL